MRVTVVQELVHGMFATLGLWNASNHYWISDTRVFLVHLGLPPGTPTNDDYVAIQRPGLVVASKVKYEFRKGYRWKLDVFKFNMDLRCGSAWEPMKIGTHRVLSMLKHGGHLKPRKEVKGWEPVRARSSVAPMAPENDVDLTRQTAARRHRLSRRGARPPKRQ